MFATIMPPKYRQNASEMPLKCHQNAANGSTWMPTLDNKTEIEKLSCYITQCSAQWSAPCSAQCSTQFSAQCSTQCSAQCSAQCSTQRNAQCSTKCTDKYSTVLCVIAARSFVEKLSQSPVELSMYYSTSSIFDQYFRLSSLMLS